MSNFNEEDLFNRYLALVSGELYELCQEPIKDELFDSLVKEDLIGMKKDVKLDLSPEYLDALLIQSIQGHAQAGHAKFTNMAYPQVTIKDVITSAELSLDQILSKRSNLINETFNLVDNIANGQREFVLQDDNPIMRVNFLKDFYLDDDAIKYFFKGMVLAGRMDNYDWRQNTLEHFGGKSLNGSRLLIGGGDCYICDMDRLKELKLDEDFLASHEHNGDALKCLTDLGVIKTDSNEGKSTYIRKKKGPGTSDDMAFITIGSLYKEKDIRYGTAAMLGAFIVDAVDTYDKFVSSSIQGGLDEELANKAEKVWQDKTGKKIVSDAEIRTIIYLSAKDQNPKLNVSSSHRRFIQYTGVDQNGKYNDGIQRPTFLHHLRYLKEGQFSNPKFRIGFTGIKSTAFYHKATERLSRLNNVLERAK